MLNKELKFDIRKPDFVVEFENPERHADSHSPTMRFGIDKPSMGKIEKDFTIACFKDSASRYRFVIRDTDNKTVWTGRHFIDFSPFAYDIMRYKKLDKKDLDKVKREANYLYLDLMGIVNVILRETIYEFLRNYSLFDGATHEEYGYPMSELSTDNYVIIAEKIIKFVNFNTIRLENFDLEESTSKLTFGEMCSKYMVSWFIRDFYSSLELK